MASLSVTGVSASYGAVKALSNVTLSVDPGKTVALLGSNGNGKSTLIKCIMGLCPPVGGTISAEIDGVVHNLVGLKPHEVVNLGIVLVPEGRGLFPKLSVMENLLLGASRRAARADIKRNLALAFEAFPRLSERKSQAVGTMSGGEQQMAAIARALMSSPRILIIDEPSVGLAPLFVSRTMAAIGALKQSQKLTVLMAEQNFAQAITIADSGYVIVHGGIAFHGRSAAELNDNDLIKKLYLG